jgi:hypothetical protein
MRNTGAEVAFRAAEDRIQINMQLSGGAAGSDTPAEVWNLGEGQPEKECFVSLVEFFGSKRFNVLDG